MAKKARSSKPTGDGLQRYSFTLTGTQPLFMHNDSVMAADTLTDWRKDPANKRRSVKGDDRSPAWSWLTYLYIDGGQIVIPCQNLIAMLIKGGTEFKGSGKYGTLKGETAASVFFDASYPLLAGPACEPVDVERLKHLNDDSVPFSEHANCAGELGFALDVRRVTVGSSKHVRVRPRFDRWAMSGAFSCYDDGAMGPEVLQQLFSLCGRRVGLCDWRPSAKKPGPYGTFVAEVAIL